MASRTSRPTLPRLLLTAALAAAMASVGSASALALPSADLATPSSAVAPGLPEAVAAHEALLALTDGLGSPVRPGDALLRVALRSADATAPPLPLLAFDDALAALYATAGLAPPGPGNAPPAALADALAPVVGALAVSSALTQQAFAGLSVEERDFLWTHLGLVLRSSEQYPVSSEDRSRFESLAARVDMVRVAAASGVLANALAAFEAPGGLEADNTAYRDPAGFLDVGGTGDDTYCDVAGPVLILDLGGNDVYCGHPASFTPWTLSINSASATLPVRAILDLHGNDQYSARFDPTTELTWGNAVGLGGIGMIVDRAGDDGYTASSLNQAVSSRCDQTLLGTAVGGLGVGAIVDLSGNDVYQTINANVRDSTCHFGWVYSFVQATAFAGGIAALLDATGDDRYHAFSESAGKADNFAHTYAQAAASGGVAALVDEEGHDSYLGDAYAHPGGPFSQIKGDFAYVVGQGATFASLRTPTADPSLTLPGLGESCFEVPLGFYNLLVCLEGGPAGFDDLAPTLALLVDVAGKDRFNVTPRAWDFNRGCAYVWAVSAAHGAAALPRSLAALLNLDVSDDDFFDARPYAEGRCNAGTRALSYGQGFGGPVQWHRFDAPLPGDGLALGLLVSAGPTDAACPPLQPSSIQLPLVERPPLPVGGAGSPLAATVADPVEQLLDDVEERLGQALGQQGLPLPDVRDLPGVPSETIELPLPNAAACKTPDELLSPGAVPGANVLRSHDSYISAPTARNICGKYCPAQAESWVQGSAARETTVDPSYRVVGVGLVVDVGGSDAFTSSPCAFSSSPTLSLARSVAQGAGVGGAGALVNVGGDDSYFAQACGPIGTNLMTLAQGMGDSKAAVPAQTVVPGGAPLATPPLEVAGTPVLGSQQVYPVDHIEVDPVTTPGATVGNFNLPAQQVGGLSRDLPPLTTEPVEVGDTEVLPAQSVNHSDGIGTPALQTISGIGLLIDLSGDNDWYSQAWSSGPLVPCYGNSGYGPNGATLGALWPFGLATDAHLWSNVMPVPTTCPTSGSGWSLGMDWLSDAGF